MLMRTPRHVRSQEDVYPSEIGGIEESPPDPKDIELEIAIAACSEAATEIEDLKDRLTKIQLVGGEADREAAALEVDEMRRQIKLLEVDVRSLTNSRNQFQNENAQLMRQVNYLERQRKKCTCRLVAA
jgi:archaellum component FlaC